MWQVEQQRGEVMRRAERALQVPPRRSEQLPYPWDSKATIVSLSSCVLLPAPWWCYLPATRQQPTFLPRLLGWQTPSMMPSLCVVQDPNLPEETRQEIQAMIKSMEDEADLALEAMRAGEAAVAGVGTPVAAKAPVSPAARAAEMRRERDHVAARAHQVRCDTLLCLPYAI